MELLPVYTIATSWSKPCPDFASVASALLDKCLSHSHDNMTALLIGMDSPSGLDCSWYHEPEDLVIPGAVDREMLSDKQFVKAFVGNLKQFGVPLSKLQGTLEILLSETGKPRGAPVRGSVPSVPVPTDISCEALLHIPAEVAAMYPTPAVCQLHSAVWDDNVEEVQRLILSSDVDVNARDWRGDTPLHQACEKGLHQI